MSKPRSLGLISVNERTIEHDLAILQRFQEFSAELLRISLLGISAIGFAVSKVLFPEKGQSQLIIPVNIKVFLIISLVFFGISASAALYHRYSSADSLSWHLQAMRRYQRGTIEDINKADQEIHQRYLRFRYSKYSILISTISLGVASCTLALSILIFIW